MATENNVLLIKIATRPFAQSDIIQREIILFNFEFQKERAREKPTFLKKKAEKHSVKLIKRAGEREKFFFLIKNQLKEYFNIHFRINKHFMRETKKKNIHSTFTCQCWPVYFAVSVCFNLQMNFRFAAYPLVVCFSLLWSLLFYCTFTHLSRVSPVGGSSFESGNNIHYNK